MHRCHTSIEKLDQGDHCRLEASLTHIMNYRLARATIARGSVSQNQKENKQIKAHELFLFIFVLYDKCSDCEMVKNFSTWKYIKLVSK